MAKFTSVYQGNLRVESTHLQSNSVIETDAPTDNNGKGERFSPTDLVATALGNCMLTIMGIKAEQMGVDIKGTAVEIDKIMGVNPRRIVEVHIAFKMPDNQYSDKEKKILEQAAFTCPVAKSLHPNIDQKITFSW